MEITPTHTIEGKAHRMGCHEDKTTRVACKHIHWTLSVSLCSAEPNRGSEWIYLLGSKSHHGWTYRPNKTHASTPEIPGLIFMGRNRRLPWPLLRRLEYLQDLSGEIRCHTKSKRGYEEDLRLVLGGRPNIVSSMEPQYGFGNGTYLPTTIHVAVCPSDGKSKYMWEN